MSKGIWDKSGPFDLLVHYPGKPEFENPIYDQSAWPMFNEDKLSKIRGANYEHLAGLTFEGSWGSNNVGLVSLVFYNTGPVLCVGAIVDGQQIYVSKNVRLDQLTQRTLDYLTEEYNKKIRGLQKHDLQRYRDIQNWFKKL